MRILIAGGFGFVGGRLGQHLNKGDHQIVLGTRRASLPPKWLSNAEVVETVWNDFSSLEKICSGVDLVIQAAGMNAQDCADDPVTALEINGVATARLVRAAVAKKVKRFVYISTAHVYSRHLTGTISEDIYPRNLHPYATSQRAGEDAVLGANKSGEIEGIVVRISNGFGAPAHKDVNCWMLLVNGLCKQAVQTRKMVLNSPGLQQRDFVPMSEVCRAIEFISLGELGEFDGALQDIINIGSGVSRSVFEMTLLIQKRFKRIFGFDLELKRPDANAGAKAENLEYRSDHLKRLGYRVNPDPCAEVDNLLHFCRESF